MKKITLLSDQAIKEGSLEVIDGLGFETYANVLSNAAANTRGPFTIGIFGEWGTGKTSLMRLIEENLASNNKTITVWFNAWRYEKEEHPIVPLVGTIVREIERKASSKKLLGEAGKNLARALRAIAYGFSAKSKVKFPGFAEVEASFIAKDMIERAGKLSSDPLLDRSLYYEAFEALSSIKIPPDSRIIVIIDDLDRCFPDLAIRLLESIKLVLSQPNFIFVIGVARRVIEGYLQHRYKEQYGIADFQGQMYLDKIVQLPFHIPPHSGRMKDFAKATLKRLQPDVQSKLSEILPIIGEALGGNPRAIIRFINNILIDLAISAALPKGSGMKDIPIEYFAISRCLQQRWPEIFSLLVSSEELTTQVSTWDQKKVRDQASLDAGETSRVATAMLSSRHLREFLGSKHGKCWLTDHNLRKATVEFLQTQRPEAHTSKPKYSRRFDAVLYCIRRDAILVNKVKTILATVGIYAQVRWDAPSRQWATNLQEMLAESKVFLFCFTPAALKSEWLCRGLETTIATQGRDHDSLVATLLLPGWKLGAVPPTMLSQMVVDLSDGIDKDTLMRLVSEIWSTNVRAHIEDMANSAPDDS